MAMSVRATRRFRRLSAVVVRLLAVAMLIQPACAVMRAAVPAASAETQESDPTEESESAESEVTTAPAAQAPRVGRRGQRRVVGLPTVAGVVASATARGHRPGLAAGHRLPNGLTAPMRC